MSYCKPPPVEHLNLLNTISQRITGDDIPRFKLRCRAEGLGAGEVEKKSVLELLQILDRRRRIAPGKYDKLREILTDIDKRDLVAQLFPSETGEADLSPELRAEKAVHFQKQQHPTSAIMNSHVLEKDLSWLASKMGPEWEQVGIQCLGMSKNDIFHCRADKPLSVENQIFSMFHKWMCRAGSAATYSNLLAKLAEFQDFDGAILDELKKRISSST